MIKNLMSEHIPICMKHSEFDPLTHPQECWLHILLCCNKCVSYRSIVLHCSPLTAMNLSTLLVCPVTQVCRWNTCIFPDKNIGIYAFMNPLEVRVTAKIFNFSWAMKSDSCYPLCYSSHLTTKHTLDVNYPQERTHVDWFWSSPFNN